MLDKGHNMPDTITLIAIIVAAIAGAGLMWIGLRRNLPPGATYDVSLAVAYVRQLLGDVVTEAEVRALASWAYDKLKLGSQYYSKEAFVDEVTRVIMHAIENGEFVAGLVERDSALVATMVQARAQA